MINFATAIRVARAIHGYEWIAKNLSASKPTIDKWANQESEPEKSYREIIMKSLEGLLDERQALIDLLSHPAGYGVQMAGLIHIRNLEDRTIAVCEELYKDGEKAGYEETIHECVEKAVDKFLNIRHRTEYGLDYDEEAWAESHIQEKLEQLESMVGDWHESDSDLPLNEFMGLTSEQYALFVSNPKQLAQEIIQCQE